LATGFFPGHLYPITALGEELVKRGHNVSLCATVMEGSDLLPDLPHSYGINFISAGPDNLTQADYDRVIKGGGLENASLSDVWKFLEQSQWPSAKIRAKIDYIGVDKFDIVVSDGSVSPVGIYYSKLGKRVAILSPLFLYLDATSDRPTTASSACNSDGFCFLNRLTDLIQGPILRLFQRIVLSGIGKIDMIYGEVLKGVSITSDIGIRVPLIMTTAFGFEYAKSRHPLTEYVGPLMMSSFTPLEDQLVEWLDNKPNRSVIYVGMGATGFITTPIATVIINGILATDFSAVWALPMSDQAILEGVDIDKDRFFISKWIPRQTLFKHPKLTMTILHCGLNGVQESLYNGLPVVCIPHGFDHFEVAGRLEHAEVGIPLYSMMESLRAGGKSFSVEKMTQVIRTITESNVYRERTEKMQRIYSFAGGAKRAADLVEFYAEVGYDHLVPAYAKYEWSWVVYYNLDVYFLLSLLSFLLIYSTYTITKHCYRRCCKCYCSSTKTKTE
jgi:glucuronosyltransferase